MIARFVDDLLHTIGEATLDELRELFAESAEGEPLFAPQFEPAEALPGLPPRATRGARVEHGAALRRSIEASLSIAAAAAAAPPAVADITDPESLLSLGGPNDSSESFIETLRAAAVASRPAPRPPVAMGLLERVERASAANAHAEPEADSPASSVRPVWSGATMRLGDNESFARVSNSGVVIRRKKKA